MPETLCQNQQNQEWIVVTKNKSRHRGSLKNKVIHNKGGVSILALEYRDEYIQTFIHSKQFDMNQKMLASHLQKIKNESKVCQFHIECLGLGSFFQSKKAFIQLQFLQNIILPLMKRIFTGDEQDKIYEQNQKVAFVEQGLSINIFDPVFTQTQKKYTENLKSTCEQKFQIKPNRINVFFMPHCERNLYEAVYEEYQKIEGKIRTPLIVIGNSIQDYKQRCNLIKQKLPGIFKRINIVEQKIFDYQNSLNDTYILI